MEPDWQAPVNHVTTLNDTTFDDYLTEHAERPVLVFFYEPTCPHCKLAWKQFRLVRRILLEVLYACDLRCPELVNHPLLATGSSQLLRAYNLLRLDLCPLFPHGRRHRRSSPRTTFPLPKSMPKKIRRQPLRMA